MPHLPIAAILVIATLPAHATNYVATSHADSGAGSLRDAITQANANPGPDAILFEVSGQFPIHSALPEITDEPWFPVKVLLSISNWTLPGSPIVVVPEMA